jgi:allophanate hydrolase
MRSLLIQQLHAEYAAGLSALAVVDEVLTAIEAAGDPGIFISMAESADIRSSASNLGAFDPVAKPLWGVPFAVKDNIDVAGMMTTAGCPQFACAATETASAVQRLLDAGAILIGKTNLDQFATGLVGVRTPYPVPRNAVDPELVPGGSSSGSAVAVARGLVSFALGTDTAGSGRVPAALNNIVGLKPSLGLVSTHGVVPACRTLDCVSVFSLTVDDAWRVLSVMAGYEPRDAYSRALPLGSRGQPPRLRIGVPDERSLEFFGDRIAEAAWERHLADLSCLGAVPTPIDLAVFRNAAALLYSGPWVAERYEAIRAFIEKEPQSLHPVTRGIIDGARKLSAADAFAGQYALAALKRASSAVWREIDVLAVPSVPTVYSLDELAADPILPNTRLGTYTNFVNLLDLSAIAVPGRFRDDDRPAGITLIAPSGRDALLAAIGERLHQEAAVTLGATRQGLPAVAPGPATAPPGWIEIVLVGAHMSGLPLNHQVTELGGTFVRTGRTLSCYRLFALPGGPPARPGLLRVEPTGGHPIEAEVWALSPDGFAQFVSRIPSPLGIGTLLLEDGSRPKGFLVEGVAAADAIDISEFGGWRNYLVRC